MGRVHEGSIKGASRTSVLQVVPRSKQQGASSKEQGARSKEQGASSNEQGARSKDGLEGSGRDSWWHPMSLCNSLAHSEFQIGT